MDVEKRDAHLDVVFGIDEPKEEEKQIVSQETIIGEIVKEEEEESKNELSPIVDENYEKAIEKNTKNLEDLYDQSKELIDGISNNAIQFNKDRTFEVASTLINTAANLQRQIKENHDSLRKMKSDKENTNSNVPNIGQQIVFAGDSRDILKSIQELRKKKDESTPSL